MQQIVLDGEVIEEHDDAANLWFTAYNVATLAAAFFIGTNSTVIENLGFLNFIYSGILVLAYESSKYRGNLRFRIAIFRLLRWSMIMLGAALVNLAFVLPLILDLAILFLAADNFVFVFYFCVFFFWIVFAYIAWIIDGRVGGFYRRMVSETTFAGISKASDKDEIRSDYAERMLALIPGSISLSVIYFIQLLVVTATLQGQGLSYLSTQIFSQLFYPSNIVLFVLLFFLLAIGLSLRRSEERKATDNLEKRIRELRKGDYLEEWVR